MTITIPDGFEVPPDADDEGEFSVVATFKDNGDNTITLLEIDGSKIKGKKKSDDDEPAPKKNLYQRGKEAGLKDAYA